MYGCLPRSRQQFFINKLSLCAAIVCDEDLFLPVSQVFVKDAIKNVKIKRFFDIPVKSVFAVIILNIFITAQGDHRQVRIFLFDELCDLYAVLVRKFYIEHNNMRPFFSIWSNMIFSSQVFRETTSNP